jgi:hypothetical protein
MSTQPLTIQSAGARPLTKPLVDPLDEGEPGRLSPAMTSKLKALIAKLRSLLAMVPPELRGKIMALISQAEAALAGIWMGDLASLVSLMERTVQLLHQLLGWGDVRDLRAQAARDYWERRRLLGELRQLLAGVEENRQDLRLARSEADPIVSLSALIASRFPG